MGWKNVKDHYRIKHIVQVTEKGICIGSPYCRDLLVLNADGSIALPHPYLGGGNEDLDRYRREIEADAAKARSLIEAPDAFARDGSPREQPKKIIPPPSGGAGACRSTISLSYLALTRPSAPPDAAQTIPPRL